MLKRTISTLLVICIFIMSISFVSASTFPFEEGYNFIQGNDYYSLQTYDKDTPFDGKKMIYLNKVKMQLVRLWRGGVMKNKWKMLREWLVRRL